MREINNDVADVGHLKFATLFKFSEFEQALQPYKDSAQYDAALRYYSACIDLLDSPRLLQPLALLKQALGELNKGRVRRSLDKAPVSTPDGGTAPDLAQIFDRLEVVESRLHSSVGLMKLPATAVRKSCTSSGSVAGLARSSATTSISGNKCWLERVTRSTSGMTVMPCWRMKPIG